MKNTSKKTGLAAESAAARYLEKNGYKIAARNYSSRYGEIDIIAETDEYVVFVEVKYRRSLSSGLPREAVTPRKIQKLRITAEGYVQEHPEEARDYRFDVIELTEDGGLLLSHIIAAF